MTRAYLVGLLVALGLIGLAASAVAVYDLLSVARVQPGTLGVLVVAFGCFFVLLGVYALEPRASSRRPHCHNCGARVFATLRSLDRREVLTCFVCGLEWALPPLRPRESLRPAE